MRVTVATVCFNSEDTIEQTIKSVLAQTYSEIEYIIVDGASTDATLDIIGKYTDNDRIRLISEPDNGLYDAMNKAIDNTTGDYIIYMNSGDIFATNDAIKEISAHLDGTNELVYGNVIRIKPEGKIRERYEGFMVPLRLLLMGRMMCHQSIFTRCDIMKQYRFNTEYTITADYDFLMRMVHDKRILKYVDTDISIVDNVNGISSDSSNMKTMRQQDDRSLHKNFPFLYWLIFIPKNMYRFIKR